jgi:hypothetical protein
MSCNYDQYQTVYIRYIVNSLYVISLTLYTKLALAYLTPKFIHNWALVKLRSSLFADVVIRYSFVLQLAGRLLTSPGLSSTKLVINLYVVLPLRLETSIYFKTYVVYFEENLQHFYNMLLLLKSFLFI